MNENTKELFPGISLVTLDVAKTLKELGWAWETPRIVRIITGEILRPIRQIDCSVGDDYMYLPTVSQVTEWLGKWGFIFTSGYETYNGVGYYSYPKIYFKDEEIDPQPKEEWWQGWEKMMIDLIPFALKYLKDHIFEVLELDEITKAWRHIGTYEWMMGIKAIAPVKFYDSFYNNPEINAKMLTGKDFKNIENEL